MIRIPSFHTGSNGQRSFSYQVPAIWNKPCFCPSFYLCQFFKSSLKTFIFRNLFFSPIALRYVRARVRACVRACVYVHLIKNAHLSVWVWRSKYPLLSLFSIDYFTVLCTKQNHYAFGYNYSLRLGHNEIDMAIYCDYNVEPGGNASCDCGSRSLGTSCFVTM